jgi:uncharacterized membrane protein YvbJ
MKCPNCGAPCGADAVECPKCGLVFAKWRERQEKEKREAAEALKALESPPQAKPPVSPLIGRLAAGVIVLLWMLGLAVYYVHRFRTR